MYYDYGMVFEELKASLLVAKIGQAIDGKTSPLIGSKGQRPDKKAFYDRYGDKIKRGGDK